MTVSSVCASVGLSCRDCTVPECFRSTYAIVACIDCTAFLAAMALTGAHAQQLSRELHEQAEQSGLARGGVTAGGGEGRGANFSQRAQRPPQRPLHPHQEAREGRSNGAGRDKAQALSSHQQEEEEEVEDQDRLSASLMEVDEIASDYGNSQHGVGNENGAAYANGNSWHARDGSLSV